MTALTNTLTKKTSRKNRSQLQQDFIPNFEIRSVMVIAAFAVSAAAACAQTGVMTQSSVGGQTAPMAMTVAADRAERPAEAMAQNSAGRKNIDAAFNRADLNHDGKLTRQETEHFPMMAQQFDAIDGNRDTFISREEFGKAAGN